MKKLFEALKLILKTIVLLMLVVLIGVSAGVILSVASIVSLGVIAPLLALGTAVAYRDDFFDCYLELSKAFFDGVRQGIENYLKTES